MNRKKSQKVRVARMEIEIKWIVKDAIKHFGCVMIS